MAEHDLPRVYPEHEKLRAVAEHSQAIGEFIDYGSYVLGEWVKFDEYDDKQLVPAQKPINQILADYFDIDLDKIEDEKRQMLEAMRAA